MTSGDNVLTVEIFNEGIREIKQSISELRSDVATLKEDVTTLKSDVATLKTDVSNLHAEVGYIQTEQRFDSAKIDWLQTSIYWGFAIIAFVVTFVGLKAPGRKTEKPKAKITNELRNAIREVVREELAKNLPNLPSQGR